MEKRRRLCSFMQSGGWRLPGGLHDTDVVAEWISNADIRAVGLLHRFLGDFNASRHQRIVGLLDIRGGEADRKPAGALGDQLAYLLGRRLVHRRWAWPLQQDVTILLTGDPDREPAHEA